jgi:uncharacterized protein YycO
MMQEFLRKYFGWLIDCLSTLIGKINWKQKQPLTKADMDVIAAMLELDYYIITTRHSNHLSLYAISLAGFLTTGKWSSYGHVCMNLEDTVDSKADFRIVEAVGVGSKYSTFEEVFGDADGICLLKPKAMTVDHWTDVLDKARTEVGKPYDTLFDLANDKAVSCVELVRDALMGEPHYKEDFPEFEKMIGKINNLTPQMFRDCPDFEVAYEIRK